MELSAKAREIRAEATGWIFLLRADKPISQQIVCMFWASIFTRTLRGKKPIVYRDEQGILQVSPSIENSVLTEHDLPRVDDLVEELEHIRTSYPDPSRGYSEEYADVRYEDGDVSWRFSDIRQECEEDYNDYDPDALPDLIADSHL
jgi:hypothetical protein